MISVTTVGLEELGKKLGILERVFKRKTIAKALREGAKVTQRAAIADAPVMSGKTKAAIKVRAGPRRKGYVAVNVVVGKKWFTGDTFYAAFELFGHRWGSRKLGNKRRRYKGHNWLKFAWDESGTLAIQKIIKTAEQMIDEAMKGKESSGGNGAI